MLIIPTHTHTLLFAHTHTFSCLAALFRLFISHCFRYVSISIGFISILSLSLDSFRFVSLCLASLWFCFCFVWCFLLCHVFYQASNQAHHHYHPHPHLLRPEQCGVSPSPADNCAKGKTGRGMQNVIGAGAGEEEKEVEDNSSRLYAPIVQARILRSRLE